MIANLNPAPLRILTSYHYFKDADLRGLVADNFDGVYPDWFGDSGAFSAFTQGATVTIGEYINWVKQYGDLFSAYANLDVIGDAAKTLENHDRMLDAGLDPLPVFHVGDDWEYLEHYLDVGYRYIGIGGAVPHASKVDDLMKWFIRSFKIADGLAVFHGFGVTGLTYIKRLGWYSVDSTAWVQGAAFGNMPIFDSRSGQLYKAQMSKPKDWQKYGHIVKAYGFSPLDFAIKERQTNERNTAFGGLAYREIERYINSKRGAISRPDRPEETGFRLYLSNSVFLNFVYVYRSIQNVNR